MQDPNADTEWNDALRKHNIIPQKDVEITEEDLIALAEDAIDKQSRGKTWDEMEADELDELEDDVDEDDERAFEQYRRLRMAEMQASEKQACYGHLQEISKADWVQEVNKAGEGVWVVVQIYKPGLTACKLFSKHLSALAQRFPKTKFVKSDAAVCFEKDYPDKNVPTMFVYVDGEMRRSWVGAECGGLTTTEADLEWRLHSLGAIAGSHLTENPRQEVRDVMTSNIRGTARDDDDDDDNDW